MEEETVAPAPRRRKPASIQEFQDSASIPDVSDEYFKPAKTKLQIDALEIVEKTYEEAEKDLTVFIESQIDLMNQNMAFHGEEAPSFAKLNRALMNYESVMSGLISVHNLTRKTFQFEQERFENLEAHLYCKVERELVTLEKKLPSKGRVDMLVRDKYMKELAEAKARVIVAENEYNLMNNLIDSWKNYQFILSRLSRNAEAEASASGVAYRNPKEFEDDNLNAPY